MDILQAGEYYRTIIERLIAHNHFGKFLFENRTHKGAELWCMRNMCLFTDQFYIVYGLTKLVVVDKTTGFVLKIPFLGVCLNYCDEEEAIYHRASECGFENMFARCEKPSPIEQDKAKINFYIMEYAEVSQARISSYVQEYYPDIGEKYDISPLGVDECVVYELLKRVLGEEKYLLICTFLEEEGVNDIHGGNIGFKNGELVLVDYSGYMGQEEKWKELLTIQVKLE